MRSVRAGGEKQQNNHRLNRLEKHSKKKSFLEGKSLKAKTSIFILPKVLQSRNVSLSPLTLTFEIPAKAAAARWSTASSASEVVIVRRVVGTTAVPSVPSEIPSALKIVARHEVWRCDAQQTRRRFRHLIHTAVVRHRVVPTLIVDPRLPLLVHVAVLHERWWRAVHVDLDRQREHVRHGKLAMV